MPVSLAKRMAFSMNSAACARTAASALPKGILRWPDRHIEGTATPASREALKKARRSSRVQSSRAMRSGVSSTDISTKS
jgi:hypothetical protein